jgi:hypothetical protein
MHNTNVFILLSLFTFLLSSWCWSVRYNEFARSRLRHWNQKRETPKYRENPPFIDILSFTRHEAIHNWMDTILWYLRLVVSSLMYWHPMNVCVGCNRIFFVSTPEPLEHAQNTCIEMFTVYGLRVGLDRSIYLQKSFYFSPISGHQRISVRSNPWVSRDTIEDVWYFCLQ